MITGDYFFVYQKNVLDLLNSEKNARKEVFEKEMEAQGKVESELTLRHDIFEVMKVENPEIGISN